jgi:ABC-type uncharacterized transport system ATPase subunit
VGLDTVSPGPSALLRMIGVTKRFGDLVADDRVDFDVRAGEIHALLGENGAGKSTLMKILYGLYQPDAGEIQVAGEPVQIDSPHTAVRHGIGMVHQQFMLVPNLTALENVVLGMAKAGSVRLDLAAARRRLVELADEYALDVEPDAHVWQLSVGAQQRLEILKAVFRGARLLVLDEPTAVLAPSEVEQLFRIVRHLASEGRGVVFITHKLAEVEVVSNRITVMRLGRVTGTMQTEDATPARLATLMVGREITIGRVGPPVTGDRPVLSMAGATCLTDRGTQGLRDISMEVRRGEILGVAGVDGNGQSELVECIAGLRPLTGGSIEIAGVQPARVLSSPEILGFIPEDRHLQGLIGDFSVAENLVLKTYRRAPFAKYQVLRWRRIKELARQLIAEYDIRTPSPLTPARFLSGGNQQRVVVARESHLQPALLVASQPTRGLDISAVDAVLNLLRRQRDAGSAVLFISTELAEVLAVSDRVIVMYRGQVMGEVPPEERRLGDIGQMMLGRTLAQVEAERGAVA